MDATADITLSKGTFWSIYAIWIGTAMAIQHLILVGAVVFLYRSNDTIQPWYVWGDALLVVLLFSLTEPITAFAVYFACWHSIGHIRELISFFRTQDSYWSLFEFYKHSWLFSFISFLGLAILYWINQAFGSELQMVALLLILISVLTLPHMLIVNILFKNHQPALS